MSGIPKFVRGMVKESEGDLSRIKERRRHQLVKTKMAHFSFFRGKVEYFWVVEYPCTGWSGSGFS